MHAFPCAEEYLLEEYSCYIKVRQKVALSCAFFPIAILHNHYLQMSSLHNSNSSTSFITDKFSIKWPILLVRSKSLNNGYWGSWEEWLQYHHRLFYEINPSDANIHRDFYGAQYLAHKIIRTTQCPEPPISLTLM